MQSHAMRNRETGDMSVAFLSFFKVRPLQVLESKRWSCRRPPDAMLCRRRVLPVACLLYTSVRLESSSASFSSLAVVATNCAVSSAKPQVPKGNATQKANFTRRKSRAGGL